MYKLMLITSVASMLALLPLKPSLAQQPDPRRLLTQSEQLLRLPGLESRTSLEIHDGKGNVRNREVSMASRLFSDGTEKRIIVFLSPSDVKGTSMLIFDHPEGDDDMWLYMPALRKVRKIASGEKNRSFMGSEFTHADMAQANPDDFIFRYEGKEAIDGVVCHKIGVKAKDKLTEADYGFADKLVWIAESDGITRKALMFDASKQPIREITYGGVVKIDPGAGKYFITHMKVSNLKTGRFSVMRIDQHQLNPAVDEQYFTQSFMEKQ